jgi:hypothetical protein
MGIVKGKNCVFQAPKKGSQGLRREGRNRIRRADRLRLSWLKRSLGTKDRKEAAVLAKPIGAGDSGFVSCIGSRISGVPRGVGDFASAATIKTYIRGGRGG